MSTSNQEAIWSHFQGNRAAVFDGAYWRLGRLVHYAAERHKSPAILNIGIGNGYLELLAHRRGWTVTSVDPDESAVKRLRGHRLDARRGLIEQLPVEDSSVDVVFASEVFEHLTKECLASGISEIRRVLKSGGHLIGTVPFNESLADNDCVCPKCAHVFHRWGHQQSFTPAKMRGVLSAFFDIEVCDPRYFPSWKMMDLRGRINAGLRIAILNPLGVHRPNENILFIAKSRK